MVHRAATQNANISHEFETRLRALPPRHEIGAIVVLDTHLLGSTSPGRSRSARMVAIAALREAARPALADIDARLARVGGHRMTDEVDALGTLSVTTTAEGVRALAALPAVRAILEDQPVRALPIPRMGL